MADEPYSWTPEDEANVKLLESQARKTRLARRRLLPGIALERASAALEEAEGILADAAENCRTLPDIPSVREAVLR